jgi:hypothetical protein
MALLMVVIDRKDGLLACWVSFEPVDEKTRVGQRTGRVTSAQSIRNKDINLDQLMRTWTQLQTRLARQQI